MDLRSIMPLNLVVSLYTQPLNPRLGIALFEISLIILFMTASTTQSTSSPQPLQCEVEVDKTLLETYISFLKEGAL